MTLRRLMFLSCATVLSVAAGGFLSARQQDTVRLTPDTATVSAFGTWSLSLIPGSPIRQGDLIRLQLPRLWQRMQAASPSSDGFVSAARQKSAVPLLIDTSNTVDAIDGYGGMTNILSVSVPVESLAAGDPLIILLGDRSGGSRGLKPNFDAGMQFLTVEVVRDGIPQHITAGITVLPRKARSFRVVAPTRMSPGEWGWVRLAALDTLGNADWNFGGTMLIERSDPASVAPSAHVFATGDSGIGTFTYRAGPDPVQRITVVDANGLRWESNPVVCDSSSGDRVFWGDPHTHSILSNHGYGQPERLFWYAEQISMLDWVAYTEHGYLGEDLFRTSQPAANRYNHPGRFVTLNGCEWTSPMVDGDNAYGHMCFYFPTDVPPYLSSEVYRTPGAIAEALKLAHGIAHVAHPVHRFYYDWGGFDSTIARNAEVIGVDYRTFEFRRLSDSLLHGEPLTTALQEKRVFGFVGGSDNHYARPGMISPAGTSGITAVVAHDLTRASVFSALYDRRTYATSGARMFLDVTANGRPMGSVNDVSDSIIGNVRLDMRAVGTAPIDSVIVMKNGELFGVLLPGSTGVDTAMTDSSVVVPVYYYVRIAQKDGHRGWSSPIWFAHRPPVDTTRPPRVVPAGFHLSEGFPNPFNSSVIFDATSERPRRASVLVVDMYGRTVRTLLHDEAIEGAMSIRWDGRDSALRVVASGVYFLFVRTDEQTVIRKMMLLK